MDVFVLALALSMDAFAVSLGLGAKQCGNDVKSLALKAGLFFGIFQALMPLIGFLAGSGLYEYICDFDHWIAFFLLGLIGAKMIYESFSDEVSSEIAKVSNRILLTLAVATSIDALAVGFTLNLFSMPILLSVLLIGITTFALSYIGVIIGSRGGEFLESKAEFLGGAVLIGIGFKILLEHLGVLS